MYNLTRICAVVLLTFIFLAPISVFACPAGGGTSPPPGSPGVGDWLLREAGLGGSGIVDGEIVIQGLTSRGSAAGDSCGIAPGLPDGFTVTEVEVRSPQDGEPVGFEKFYPESGATLSFCQGVKSGCTAFGSKVSKNGIKSGSPMEIVIRYKRSAHDVRSLPDTARRILRDGTLALGDINSDGLPRTHFLLLSPQEIDVTTMPKKTTPKEY